MSTLQAIKDKYQNSVGFQIKRTSDQVIFTIDRFSSTHYYFKDGTSLAFTVSGFEEILIPNSLSNLEVQEQAMAFSHILINTFRMENKIKFDDLSWPESYRDEMLVELDIPIRYLTLGMLKVCRDWFLPFVPNTTWMDQNRKDGFLDMMNDEITRLGL